MFIGYGSYVWRVLREFELELFIFLWKRICVIGGGVRGVDGVGV